MRESQGQPPLPTNGNWSLSRVFHIGGPFEGTVGTQRRTRWEWTGWENTGAGAVGNTGEDMTFTGSAKVTEQEKITFNFTGKAYKVLNIGFNYESQQYL